MVKIKLKYLVEDLDRHGNVRCYVRLPGRKKIRIRGVPSSEEFMSAYHAALTGVANDQKKQFKPAAQGSFRHLCIQYYKSGDFKILDPATKDWRRRALDLICEKYGEKPFASLEPRNIKKLRDELRDHPATSKKRLKALRALFKWAVEEGEADRNPALGVRSIPYVEKGHHTITSEEVDAFERRHPIGTKARLAFALMLYSACRREDVVRLGPQHISSGRLQYTQAKNEHRNPTKVDIPLHPKLRTIIESTPSQHLTFLVTEHGRPFSAKGFGMRFKMWCRQAGLPHCSAHGLRKAAASRLAEAGATALEIMAVTGHRSIREIERYTKEASKRKLADSAISKLK